MTQFEEAMADLAVATEKIGRGLRGMGRVMERQIVDTPGDHHIERIIKEILDGKPGRDPALRLLCASDFAEVLDEYAKR